MSYAEVEFLKAEAVAKSWDIGDGNTESHYEVNVRVSMELLNNYYLTSGKISERKVNAFTINNPLGNDPKGAVDTQTQILCMMSPLKG